MLYMKDITFLNSVDNLKTSIWPPFPKNLFDFDKNIRVKGDENEAISLCNLLEKQALSLRNGFEK